MPLPYVFSTLMPLADLFSYSIDVLNLHMHLRIAVTACLIMWWCDKNSHINTKKTEEIISDCQLPPVTNHTTEIKWVSLYKYLGVMIDGILSWIPHIEFRKKIQQHRLRSFGASSETVSVFHPFKIVLLYCSGAIRDLNLENVFLCIPMYVTIGFGCVFLC